MKCIVYDINPITEKIRLITKIFKRESLEEFPEPMKWSLQMIYFCGVEWIQVCRIDNYPHQGVHGAHIHSYGTQYVARCNLIMREARQKIFLICSRVLMER